MQHLMCRVEASYQLNCLAIQNQDIVTLLRALGRCGVYVGNSQRHGGRRLYTPKLQVFAGRGSTMPFAVSVTRSASNSLGPRETCSTP